MFVDRRTITIAGGKGGDGIVHWHREKYVAKGGPDGGDGGDGGNAYIMAVRDVYALARYREDAVLRAQDGFPGTSAIRSGKNGEDIVVHLPVGSIVTNETTKEKFELMEDGRKILVATGGRGGLGNAHFKSSTNTTPKRSTPGEPPQSYRFHVNLALIADIGIIGLPNAGKSTLLNALTNATAKVAAYPFTTREPNLGVCHGYVLADIPGLIEHASEGRGLGHRFLRHIERTRILVHLVAADSPDAAAAYATVRTEMGLYNPELLEKREIVILSKIDCVDSGIMRTLRDSLPDGTIPLTVLDDDGVKIVRDVLLRECAADPQHGNGEQDVPLRECAADPSPGNGEQDAPSREYAADPQHGNGEKDAEEGGGQV